MAYAFGVLLGHLATAACCGFLARTAVRVGGWLGLTAAGLLWLCWAAASWWAVLALVQLGRLVLERAAI